MPLFDDGNGTWDLDQDRTHNAANEITDLTVWADPAYDDAGNTTRLPLPASPTNHWQVKYDAWNRLIELRDGTTGTIVLQAFEYDGLGRRISRYVHSTGVTSHYDYNEQWRLVETRVSSSANPIEQFVWHPYYIDALAVRYYDANVDGSYGGTNEGDHYYCQDANFNVTAVVNSSGSVLERYNYTPYGDVTFLDPSFAPRSSSLIANQHLYTGRERDPETGLQLNRHRYYASHLGRWLTRDPVGYEDSGNLYEMVRSRPLSGQDPSGLRIWLKECDDYEGYDCYRCCEDKYGGDPFKLNAFEACKKSCECRRPRSICDAEKTRAACKECCGDRAAEEGVACIVGCIVAGPYYWECVRNCGAAVTLKAGLCRTACNSKPQ